MKLVGKSRLPPYGWRVDTPEKVILEQVNPLLTQLQTNQKELQTKEMEVNWLKKQHQRLEATATAEPLGQRRKGQGRKLTAKWVLLT